jgi:hypothetical protein
MAEHAVLVGDAKKLLGGVGGHLIEQILAGTWAAGDEAAEDKAEPAVFVGIWSGGRDELARDDVVGLVGDERVLHILIESVAALGEAVHLIIVLGVLEEVAEKHLPLVDPLRAGQQFIDVGGSFVASPLVTNWKRRSAVGGRPIRSYVTRRQNS